MMRKPTLLLVLACLGLMTACNTTEDAPLPTARASITSAPTATRFPTLPPPVTLALVVPTPLPTRTLAPTSTPPPRVTADLNIPVSVTPLTPSPTATPADLFPNDDTRGYEFLLTYEALGAAIRAQAIPPTEDVVFGESLRAVYEEEEARLKFTALTVADNRRVDLLARLDFDFSSTEGTVGVALHTAIYANDPTRPYENPSIRALTQATQAALDELILSATRRFDSRITAARVVQFVVSANGLAVKTVSVSEEE